MNIFYKNLALLIGAILCCSFSALGQDGATIFKENCAACHMLGQRLVGPDLLGVNDRKDAEWLLKFIKSPQSIIQSGDPYAVALFEEYNKIMMNDQSVLSDDQIMAVLAYIKDETPSQEAVTTSEEISEEVEVVPVEYTEEDINLGLLLFSGKKSLIQGGPSCISCHNVNNDQLLSGGLLAKDLTNVYQRMGDAGVGGILGAPPFPAMATAYKDNELDSAEIVQLTAFLKHADSESTNQELKSGANIFVLGGGGGLIVLFLLITFYWNKRLRESVKNDIYKRQIKSI